MTDQIRAAVETIMQAARVTFSAVYRGTKKDALGDSKHEMDAWGCEFTFDGRPLEPVQVDFYTGLGLRAEATVTDRQVAKHGFPGLTENDIKRGTSWGRRYLAAVEARRKPQAPHAATVLHSMILDSCACEESFADWCSNFGYDTDSRKALATYEACQQSGDKLRRLFSREHLEQLREALQDY